ncbi:hypothetical protein DIPPA_33095 [Diplonema papillatum]|nr:hypothetical protein DIPPA_33095 [Diplonema papillatum]
MAASRRFLNTTIDHCKYKDKDFALRELLANAIDANRGLTDTPPTVDSFYSELVISDDGDGVRDSDFRVGQTGGFEGTIGSFGTGLLDAIAIFCRLGVSVTATAGWWSFTFPVTKREDIHLEKTKLPTFHKGTKWVIGTALSPEKLTELKSYFLTYRADAPFYRSDHVDVYQARVPGKGVVYINGRRVDGVTALTFDYDFVATDMLDFGREHKVSHDLFKGLLQHIAPCYKNHPRVFYDNLPHQRDWKYEKNCYELQFVFEAKIMMQPPQDWMQYQAPAKRQLKKRKPRAREPEPVTKVKNKNKNKNQTVAPTAVVVDYNAALHAGLYEQILVKISRKERLVLIGTDLPAVPKTVAKGTQAPRYITTANRTMTALACGMQYADPTTLRVYIGVDLGLRKVVNNGDYRAAISDIAAPPAAAPQPTPKQPSTATTASTKSPKSPPSTLFGSRTAKELEMLYKANCVHEGNVQPVKETLDKWLAGVDHKILLGGSLKKGVATKNSDVDLIVSVTQADLRKAEQLVEAHAVDHERLPAAKDNALLVTETTAFGGVDVVMTCPQYKAISEDNLQTELEWFSGAKQATPGVDKVIVLAKVWSKHHSFPLSGSTMENLVVAVARRHVPSGPLDRAGVRSVLLETFQQLAKGQQVVKAAYPPHDNMTLTIEAKDWKLIAAQAQAEVAAFSSTPQATT